MSKREFFKNIKNLIIQKPLTGTVYYLGHTGNTLVQRQILYALYVLINSQYGSNMHANKHLVNSKNCPPPKNSVSIIYFNNHG